MYKTPLYPLLLTPTIKDYIWGGRTFENFLPAGYPPTAPIAEVWAVYAENRIENGPLAGETLNKLCEIYGENLLGTLQKDQSRFPLLIKLLDCNQWLSVQVHPDDEQAQRLEGDGHNGKTEAWFVLDAQPKAELIAGVIEHIESDRLASAILKGNVLDVVERHVIQKGDTIFIAAGTIHALGPGALVYEVQQNSDITYRVYDWERPASAGRHLHIEQSIEVTRPDAVVKVKSHNSVNAKAVEELISCPYFRLEILQSKESSLQLDTHKESFHAITIIEGEAQISTTTDSTTLKQYETTIIPAECGQYTIKGNFSALKSSLSITNEQSGQTKAL
ncbi:MAG: mannose-6-phosphate isomerase [Chloroflexi bacterium HGW-Chloroflexi-10]|nr:MAG: mannose-6-phosphate isomerase [Chloroflexi bacterium HGW-Chloroflexi-10]